MIEQKRDATNKFNTALQEGSIKGTLLHMLKPDSYAPRFRAFWQAQDRAREQTLAQLQADCPELYEMIQRSIKDNADFMYSGRIEERRLPYFARDAYYELMRRHAFDILLDFDKVYDPDNPDDFASQEPFAYSEEFGLFKNNYYQILLEDLEKNNIPHGESIGLLRDPEKPYW